MRDLRALALVVVLSLGGWACSSGNDPAPDDEASTMADERNGGEGEADARARTEDATDGELVEDDPTADVDWTQVEAPVEMFEPPKAVNSNAELRERSIRTLSVCKGWERVGGYEEPEAYDIDALIRYGMQGYSYLNLVDLDQKIENRKRQSERDPVEVPIRDEVKKAYETVRMALYHFQVRLNFAKSMVKDKRITEDQLKHRIDLAYVHLAAAEYTDATRLLDKFFAEEC